MGAVSITNYYAAINELAAMLADGEINKSDWKVQRDMLYHVWHKEDVWTM